MLVYCFVLRGVCVVLWVSVLCVCVFVDLVDLGCFWLVGLGYLWLVLLVLFVLFCLVCICLVCDFGGFLLWFFVVATSGCCLLLALVA